MDAYHKGELTGDEFYEACPNCGIKKRGSGFGWKTSLQTEILMTDTIKVRAMQALAGVFGDMASIGSVHRWQGSPTDLDRVKLPALFFWDEDETRDRRNRLAMGTLKLYIAVFGRLSPSGAASFNDVADNLQGEIHNALIGTSALQGLVEKLLEERVWKEYPNDQYGVLFMSFTLTYAHAWGDAFSTTY